MRSSSKIVWTIFFLTLLIAVWVFIRHVNIAPKNLAISHKAESHKQFEAKHPSNISTNNTSSNESVFQVLSETLTSTGRVYLVSKNGLTKTAILSGSPQFTREQLEQFAFPSANQIAPSGRPANAKRNEELVFYGIAVDEMTNTVIGASVEANVLVGRPNEKMIREVTRTVSGVDGRFDLKIPWGQQMMLTVTADTNHLNPPPQWFQYGSVGSLPIHHPYFDNPVMFVFQTRKAQEELFSFQKRFRAPNNGKPVQIDLTTGEMVSQGGDLVVSINCAEPYTEMRPFPWSAKVAVVDGGLIQAGNQDTRMEYLHEAPVAGYLNSFEIKYNQDTPAYRRQSEGWFYVSSRNGAVYSKIYFDINTFWDERGVPFGIRAVVNPNGSRNLQSVSQ
jgi:hypothetical protein